MDYEQVESDLRDWPVANKYSWRGAEAISLLRAKVAELEAENQQLRLELLSAHSQGEALMAENQRLQIALAETEALEMSHGERIEKQITTLKSALCEALEQLEAIRLAVEPYDDIKPRDWKSDRSNLRDAHQCAKEAIATINEALK